MRIGALTALDLREGGKMGKSTRQMKRQRQKNKNKDLKQKVGLFNKMGDECYTCRKEFDKTNKEMVKSWYVTVRHETVKVYCPTCWKEAQKIAEDFRKHLMEKK